MSAREASGDPDFVAFRSCGRKRRYRSFRIARKRARTVELKFEYGLRPYHCKFCGGYHLTSDAARRRGSDERSRL